MRKFAASVAAVGATVVFSGLGALIAPAASALVLPPGGLVNAPEYCAALYGDPSPCPPPDHPVDPTCPPAAHPVYCPYQP